ncbi:SGNH/GDSL hydrolase family protein [Modestobacter sp. VKM Ac-2984]|uniref:SGNH/GDSL hydrolase family protein n=1 Tax=Modestobacter sp. VKM Ac-2984 TaxID=3004138 RepID=UPI0022AADAC3|nr:hypothetical protein [Modestobacter sp. VKM Ac-2984]MCZ2817074.1 hypothetical protein [Modestobacter sp. VKM Ac-2984]
MRERDRWKAAGWRARQGITVLSVVCSVIVGVTCWPLSTVSATSTVERAVEAADPYVFGIGDSLMEQCREGMGLGERSVGYAAWPGATSTDLIGRLTGAEPTWPDWTVTEGSLHEERAWLEEAGSLLISLGTNDVKELTLDEWRANVAWFMNEAHGRPVLWFTIHNPVFPEATERFNDELRVAAASSPNLILLDWAGWAERHPGALLPDGVHLATFEHGCQRGRHLLAEEAVPAYRTVDEHRSESGASDDGDPPSDRARHATVRDR